jgi:hypothetical protein
LANDATAARFLAVGAPIARPSIASNSGTMLQIVASGFWSWSSRRSLYQWWLVFHQCLRASAMPYLASAA